jgi:hypothetical protein
MTLHSCWCERRSWDVFIAYAKCYGYAVNYEYGIMSNEI